MTPKSGADSVRQLAGAEDEKLHKIVDEVDRFFKSVHADIEDWKFSMEDYGDGTRIFVRFQIHINNSGALASTGRAKDAATDPSPVKVPVGAVVGAPGGRTLPDGRAVTEDIHEPEGVAAARRADLDLASFVEVWRGKQDSNTGGEYHKPGAPYLDAQSEWKGHPRTSGEIAPNAASESADETPTVPDADA
jgi:hypothetical protein